MRTRYLSTIWPLLLLLVFAVALVACRDPASTSTLLATTAVLEAAATPTPTRPPAVTTEIPTPVNSATPTGAAPTPIFTGELSPPCGVLLPPLPSAATTVETARVSDDTRDTLRSQAPASAWPALQRLLDAPGTVGLVAFQAGQADEGIYLNAGKPMPLASVAKIITLVAYVEAVAGGQLNPLEQVLLADLDRYYLPNFDLGAHRRALAELREDGRVLSPESDNAAVLLEDVPWMMIRHSSNAAADYLHERLGQARIEETAVALGLNEPAGSHSAPCSFLGQFLMMANHTRGSANDRAILAGFADDLTRAGEYGSELSLLADAYTNQADFRVAEQAWRSQNRRPTFDTQRYFADRLAPEGTAAGYAALMFRLAQNGLSNPDSSFQARRYLEWPNQFPANQELFSNVGYKNGSLPGVLTTAYYAYRWNDVAPVIVVLFYRALPQQTYRDWRSDLPHDELARWLLADPAAIPYLSAVIREMDSP